MPYSGPAACALLAGIALAAPLPADLIRLTDGAVLDEVSVVEEGLETVVYKQGSSQRTVPSDKVLAVVFDELPPILDEAEALLARENLPAALEQLDFYVDGQIASPSERRKWPAPLAAYRALQLRVALADAAGVPAAADRLIRAFADSRYVPAAYLAKASAELQADRRAEAQKTLGVFEELIQTRQLSRRWSLECRLARIQADADLAGSARRAALAEVAAEAAEFPTVLSRAAVLEGETYLAEAGKEVGDSPAAQELRERAQRLFQRVIHDFQADDETLAGAYCGLGDCLYGSGATKPDRELLEQAAVAYLRVVIAYPGQVRYAPHALYHAGRCFHLLDDGDKKRDMLRTLKSLYPSSPWAAEADRTF